MTKNSGLLETLRKYSEWVIPTGAVALVFVMLVPLPSIVLDLLLTLSITLSVLVLLTAIQVLRPVEFSVFPSLILLLTLMRLALDLASTRRILLHGSEGSSAAGKVIEAFGQFVVGGNYIVGFVIFIALIAIQYLVVSHGAVRTAEVTARFTLDAMPGKQMAIDSDLNTGLINADQARQRREQVAREAEFCGSMDGAARFDSGIMKWPTSAVCFGPPLGQSELLVWTERELRTGAGVGLESQGGALRTDTPRV